MAKSKVMSKIVDLSNWILVEKISRQDLYDYVGRSVLFNENGNTSIIVVQKDVIRTFLEVIDENSTFTLLRKPFELWFKDDVQVGQFPMPSEIIDGAFDYVINVSDEYIESFDIAAAKSDAKYFWFPMNEVFGDIGLNSLYGALQILYIAKQKEANVLVHCKAGANRSQLVADAYYFMRTGKHRPIKDKKSRRETNEWLGIPVGNMSNSLEDNCQLGHLPSIDKVEKFIALSDDVFQRQEADKNGKLDEIKLAAGITDRHKRAVVTKLIAKITYTPMSNIENRAVKDNELVKIGEFDALNDVFRVKCEGSPDRTVPLEYISLYDDLVVIDGAECKILHMLTKNK